MNEMINRIGERMTNKAKLANRAERMRKRESPFYSEFVGMRQMLETMGIDYKIDWDETATIMTAITIMGKRFEI